MHKIHIFTQGCTANQSDSEVMAGLLQKAGYTLVDSPDAADLIILNTCTVKSPTEMKAFSYLKKYQKKKFVVAGCIPQSDPKRLAGYSLIGTRQIHRIVDIVAATLEGHAVSFLDMDKSPRLNLPKVRKNEMIEIIPINAGCLGACTFCKTKQARGGLFSYAVHDIIKEVETAVSQGVKEIHLTSQDTGAYGVDIGTNLPSLIDQIVKVPGDFKVRIGMANPDLVKRWTSHLLKSVKSDKVFKFLHIPVQSGSDKVLKDMGRHYTREDFIKIIKLARKEIPNITISTDVICGFPTETEDDFQQTYDLLEELKIPVINISKFYPRPDTPAAKMKKIPTHIVKSRSTMIVQLHKSTIDNGDWLGWTGRVLIDEQGKDCMKGRNDFYKQVIVPGSFPLGYSLRVKVMKTTQFDLIGKMI